MDLPLSGQTALVTGGAKGFGLGIALALKKDGARVVVTGRDQTALHRAEAVGLIAVRADATVPADWDRVIQQVLEKGGRLDILVNNAGGGVKIAATEHQDDASI